MFLINWVNFLNSRLKFLKTCSKASLLRSRKSLKFDTADFQFGLLFERTILFVLFLQLFSAKLVFACSL